MKLNDITIGSDPEFFVENKHGHVIPAYFALHGDKDIDLPYGTAYPDGAAVEMTVDYDTQPEVVATRLGNNIRATEAYIGVPLSVRSNGYVAQEYIDMLTPSYGKRCSLQILGCKRDERVYQWAESIKRPDPKTYEWRTLGGHIHIGVGKNTIKYLALVQFTVAMLDALLGTAGTYLCDEQESRDRKKLYGKSGTIRLKKYGAIEYRSLPAKALASNYELAFNMFSLAQKVGFFAQEFLTKNSNNMAKLYELIGGQIAMQTVSEAIDTHSVEECRMLQLRAASDYDRTPYSPGFMPHVEAIQSMTMPNNFSVEW